MAASIYQAKPFQTFEQQADILLSKGLIASREELISLFNSVNYYRFKGYLQPFRESIRNSKGKRIKGENYVVGTTLTKVWEYYLFDRRLRFLVLDAIERIEIALRTQIAYQWAQSAGCPNPQGDISNYNSLWSGVKFTTLISAVQKAFDRSQSDFVRQQKSLGCSDVKDLPVWIFVELTTLGELTRIYKGLDFSLQKIIAEKFGFSDGLGSVDTDFFYSLMSLFQLARNACAHHARIWNVEWNQHYPQKTKQGIMFPPVVVNTKLQEWNQWWIESQKAWMHRTGKHSFQRQSTAFLLTACSYFINRVAPKSYWKQRFDALVNRPETPHDVLTVMKFSSNWRTHPFWNL